MAPKTLAKRASGTSAACKPLSAAPKWQVVAAIVIVAFLVVALIYFGMKRASANGSGSGGAEGFAEDDSPVVRKLVYLRMNGCGWCDRFTPTWNDMQSKHAKDLKKDMGVQMASFEREDAGAAPYKDFVKGFPCILYVDEDVKGAVLRSARFEGDRTVELILAFVQEQVALSEAAEKKNKVTKKEGFEDTEFGVIISGVKKAKKEADGHTTDLQQDMTENAGTDVAATSAVEKKK